MSESQRQTWIEWGLSVSDDNKLITREELLTSLKNAGITITPIDLRNWQQMGVIPYGDRRWDEKTQKTRTMYPPVMVQIIQRLRQLQSEGHKLSTIGSMLRYPDVARCPHCGGVLSQ